MPTGNRPRRNRDQLDAFLRVVIKNKYRWRRREIFIKFLEQHENFDSDTITALIPALQKNGVSNALYQEWLFDVPKWLAENRKKRAFNAAIARWQKKFQ